MCWISVHPDLMARDYGVTPDHVLNFMASLGYTHEYLGADHERHYFFA
jgi:hypothetical protein